jgi:hypothetical protein
MERIVAKKATARDIPEAERRIRAAADKEGIIGGNGEGID